VRRIATLIRKKTGLIIDTATLLDQLRHEAAVLVDANWFAIERVAQGLLERWTLDQDSVDALIEAAWLDQGHCAGPHPHQGEYRQVVEEDFTNWKQALEYTCSHVSPDVFVCELVIKLEKTFPWMIIDSMEISIKPT
jgi:hypothetical protein